MGIARGPGQLRRSLPDVIGVAWVIAAGIAVLAPALWHGASLGTIDLGTQWGLAQQPGTAFRQLQGSDQITLFIPWTSLAWTQVHHGHLPLWNPYSLLGSPLAFNWESAPFSLPSLISYLFPLRLAYTAAIITNLVIGGTGVYVLGRVMRLGVLGCTLAGVVYELSGPFMGLLGWPIAWVMAWAGWLFAAAILIVRGRHRVRDAWLLAVVVAFACYAGEPEGLLLLGIAMVVFMIVVMAFRTRRLGGEGPIRRPLRDLVLSGAAGGALAAPLILPGLQVASGSVRNVSGPWIEVIATNSTAKSLPLHDMIHVLFQGFDGLPLRTNVFFDDRLFYIDTVAYVGVIAVVLALAAVVLRRRQPEVIGFGAVLLVMAGLVYVQPVVSLVDHVPHLGDVLWNRALLPMAFVVAILSGVGIDQLVRGDDRRAVRRWVTAGFASAGGVLILLWLFGRGQLPAGEASIRAHSFIWPAVAALLGLVAVIAATKVPVRAATAEPGRSGRRRVGIAPIAGGALLVCETAFLITAGAPLWASSPTFVRPTPAVSELKATVGSSVVGFGTPECNGYARLGIQPDVNLLYKVDEFVEYDPMTPRQYFSSWKNASGVAPGYPSYETFCPAVTTAALARLYGVGYVLEPLDTPGPKGAVFDKVVGSETLFRVPGAAAATVSDLGPGGSLPGKFASGTPVAVTHPDPASWKLVTDAKTPKVLRLRLTNLTGWHASVNGKPLNLTPFASIMLQARVPAGRNTVVLSYWPTSLTEGIVLAACSAGSLVAASSVVLIRRRTRRAIPARAST